MATLIILLLIGLAFGIFTAQNTQHVQVTFLTYTVKNVPIYILILVPLIVGIIIAWIFSLFGSFTHLMSLKGKNKTIEESKKSMSALQEKMKQIELENNTLKEKLKSQSKKTI